MVRPNFPSSIDRRRLLKSAVAATAAGILPLGGSTEAAAVQAAYQSPSFTADVGPRSVCPATARRVLEIEQRNVIRRGAGLPLLSIPKELRRLKGQEELAAFEWFAATRRTTAWEQVLRSHPGASANPNWRPSWAEGIYLQGKVDLLLRKQFRKTVCREHAVFSGDRATPSLPAAPLVD